MEVPIPNEVISEILSHLGKNDLLKCRLVCQSWNELSLKILRNPKYEHEHELTKDNIEKFIEFSNGRQGEWILPFYLYFGYDKNAELVDYFEIANYVRQLQAIYGGNCVNSLTLTHESYFPLESVEELISILTLIASSLTYLDLSDFKLYYNEEREITTVKEVLGGMTELIFKKMSRLMSCPSPIFSHEDNRQEKRENELHSFLIQKSQNLTELDVISALDISVTHNQPGILKLKIEEPLQLLDTFVLPNLPVLSDLSLTYSSTLLDHQILFEFLSSFSTSLQSLSVIFDEIPTNPFPRLDQLRFLGIEVSIPTRSRILVDLEKLNLNSEAFPVLESMEVATNVHFESSDANSGSSKDDRSLQTVKNLCIRVYPCDQEEYDEDGETMSTTSANENDYVDHLQELFPNVTSLTLVNEREYHEEYFNDLLIAFIQSDGAPRIQELKITDFEENYLGQILNGLDIPDHQPTFIIKNMRLDEELLMAIKKSFQRFSGGSELSVDKQLKFKDGVETRLITCKAPTPVHLKMTGLEKIKIHTRFSTKSKSIDESERESHQKDLFLMSLPKNFPILRQIDISQRMFGDDKEFCRQQIINVQEKFPDLIINTTHEMIPKKFYF